MHTLSTPLTTEERHAHNEVAALLSIVPGLGHIYKGHYEMGLMWMFLGMPIALATSHGAEWLPLGVSCDISLEKESIPWEK